MNSLVLLSTAVAFITSLQPTQTKTVVFYPPPLTSYLIYHSSIAAELANFGHEVWLCVPHFMIQKLTVPSSVNVLDYGEYLSDPVSRIYEKARLVERFFEREAQRYLKDITEVSATVGEVLHEVLSDSLFKEKVRNLKPDLFVLDSKVFNMNMIVLPYMLDIPYALIGAAYDVILTRVPFSPATTPFSAGRASDRMTFFKRVQSTLFYLARINVDLFYDSSVISEFAPNKPYKSINELAANAEIIISEAEHVVDYARPMLPNTKLVGGFCAIPAKPLTGEFKLFADEAVHGVIVASFGSSVLNVPEYITSKLASAFKQLDLRVVWRANITSPDPDQIMTSLWLPQNDLLGHNKTRLFVSHCGQNGQYEAVYQGVPILCLPIYGDQFYNAERIVVKQLGLEGDMRDLGADELARLMKQLIYDKKYSENMKKASKLYRELYKIPKHEAAYWLDHVMRYGGEYMRSSGQQMPWYQLYVLDVIAFLIMFTIAIIALLYLITRQCYRIATRKHRNKTSKTE